MANLIRGLSENGGVVFCGVDSTQIVRKAEKLHTTSATCSAALGRLLTGAALMGSMLKDDRAPDYPWRVSGGGPAGVVIACTDGTGNVRAASITPWWSCPQSRNGHPWWRRLWAKTVCSPSSGITACKRSLPWGRCRWSPARSPRT